MLYALKETAMTDNPADRVERTEMKPAEGRSPQLSRLQSCCRKADSKECCATHVPPPMRSMKKANL